MNLLYILYSKQFARRSRAKILATHEFGLIGYESSANITNRNDKVKMQMDMYMLQAFIFFYYSFV